MTTDAPTTSGPTTDIPAADNPADVPTTDVPLFTQTRQAAPDGGPFTTTEPPRWGTTPPPKSQGTTLDQTGEPSERIDWKLVRQLKARADDEIDKANPSRALTEADRRQLSAPIIDKTVRHHAAMLSSQGRSWDADTQRLYRKSVTDLRLGYGRLEPLFHIPTAEDVVIVGAEKVVVRHNDGTVETRPPVADSADDLLSQLKVIGDLSTPKRTLDASHLDMTVMLRDRFRLHAISNEVALAPRVVIRQHLLREVSLADMADLSMMPEPVARLLHAAVRGGLSIVVAGAQGAGKTTLLRALIDAIPPWEFFGTLETDVELFAHLMPERQHNLALVSRSGMGERDDGGQLRGAVGISALVDPALRQTLDRLIVGETRGPEASALLQAMQVGTGTLSTTHAKNAVTVADRLAGRIAADHVYSKAEALDEIGHCIDLVVYVSVSYDADGRKRRFISDIRTVGPGDPTSSSNGVVRPTLGVVYQSDRHGNAAQLTPNEDLQELIDTHGGGQLNRYRRPGQKVAVS